MSDRKPKDYDESEVPKIQGSPLSLRRDYGVEGCGEAVELSNPLQVPTVLICPECAEEAPIALEPPAGVMLSKLAFECPACKHKIPWMGIAKSASDGKFRLV